jgi:hypothetical protein
MSDRRAQLEAFFALAAELATLPAEAPAAPIPPPAYMTPIEFARHVRLAPATIRKMADEGMPHTRPRPRSIRIKVAEAEEWIAARSAKPARSATVAARKGRLQ